MYGSPNDVVAGVHPSVRPSICLSVLARIIQERDLKGT